MTKPELEQHVQRLRDEIERERVERSSFQLENDKIRNILEIKNHQLDDKCTELQKCASDFEDENLHKERELKNQNQISHARIESDAKVKLLEDHRRQEWAEFIKTQYELKATSNNQDVSNKHMIRKLTEDYEKQLFSMRSEYHEQSKTREATFKRRLDQQFEELDLQRRNELHELEERKNAHISRLAQSHEKDFNDMKKYYNDITTGNLMLIDSLKKQAAEITEKDERLEKVNRDLTKKNQQVNDLLEKSTEENSKLLRKLEDFESNKEALKRTKELLRLSNKEKKSLQWKFDIIEERFKALESERDDLYHKFVGTIQDVQQKCGLKNLMLEKRLTALSQTLENKTAHLDEVLNSSSLDGSTMNLITRRLEEVLQARDTTMKESNFNLIKINKV